VFVYVIFILPAIFILPFSTHNSLHQSHHHKPTGFNAKEEDAQDGGEGAGACAEVMKRKVRWSGLVDGLGGGFSRVHR
jgi:hypothetical protein